MCVCAPESTEVQGVSSLAGVSSNRCATDARHSLMFPPGWAGAQGLQNHWGLRSQRQGWAWEWTGLVCIFRVGMPSSVSHPRSELLPNLRLAKKRKLGGPGGKVNLTSSQQEMFHIYYCLTLRQPQACVSGSNFGRKLIFFLVSRARKKPGQPGSLVMKGEIPK